MRRRLRSGVRSSLGVLNLPNGAFPVVVWLTAVLISAVLTIRQQRTHAEELARAQAKAMFDHVVLMRSWNARHGGVYVPVSASSSPDPYLPAAARVTTTVDGQTLAWLNPAYMTRQLSELAAQSEGVQFRLTSLQPIRPENAPTPWERRALESFRAGKPEFGEFDEDRDDYRYMAPLRVEPACLGCHAAQGYRVGDIRGGISVVHPALTIVRQRDDAIRLTVISHALVFLLVAALVLLYARSQVRVRALAVAKASAEQANAMKGRFIANVSHELRTPLNAILGQSHALHSSSLTPEQRASVDRIAEVTRALSAMIDRVLAFSSIDAGAMTLTVAPLRLRSLVRGSIDSVQARAAAKGLALTLSFDGEEPEWLLGDAQHLQQALAHVLDNAIRFTPTGAVSIAVHVAPERGRRHHVTIAVTDTGVGMNVAEQWLMQHDVVQLGTTLSRRAGGIGLGLTMTHRLVELMGGKLHIDSQPGRGSCVSLELWLAPAGAGGDSPGASGSSRLNMLSANQRAALVGELEQLLATQDVDVAQALEMLERLQVQYRGTQVQDDLDAMVNRMRSFDSDAVAGQVRALQQKLSTAAE